MKVLILARYDRQGASSRLRTMQYRSYLAGVGLETQVESLFDSDYLMQVYQRRRLAGTLAKSILHRMFAMRAICTQADVVWLEYEALPWFPWSIERRFWPNVPVVTDYDDAIFHRYDQNQHLLVRNILGRKIDSVMRASTVVIAGNGYLAEHTKKAGAKRVETVPTVVDTEVYQVSRAQRDDNRIRIGWIGIPETWTRFASDFTDSWHYDQCQ